MIILKGTEDYVTRGLGTVCTPALYIHGRKPSARLHERLGSFRKHLRQRHVGRHQTTALMNKTMKMQTTIGSSLQNNNARAPNEKVTSPSCFLQLPIIRLKPGMASAGVKQRDCSIVRFAGIPSLNQGRCMLLRIKRMGSCSRVHQPALTPVHARRHLE